MKIGISFILLAGMTIPLPAAGSQDPKPAAGAHIVGYSALNKGDEHGSAQDKTAGSGPLRIIYSDGTNVVVANEKGDFTGCDGQVVAQADFDEIHLAKDRQTIGWRANYMVCAQSYPCPAQLVIYRSGRVQKIAPSYGIIWGWKFLKGGEKVAMQSGFPHGDDTGEYALYETGTGRKLAEYSLKENSPGWVQKFLSPDQ